MNIDSVFGKLPLASANLTVEVTSLREIDYRLPSLRTTRFRLPLGEGEYSPGHLNLAYRDIQIIGDIMLRHPKEVLDVANLFTSGRLDEAYKLASGIGLTESQFVDQGGGAWGLLVLVVVVCLSLTGDSPQPTSQQKAQNFKISEENAELMDGIRRD